MLFLPGFEIDLARAELRRTQGEVVKLRPKSFDMLVFFAENAGRIISKHELLEQLWPGLHVSEDSLFQCVRDIRAAIGDSGRQMLRSVSGRGYIFDVEVTRPGATEAPPMPVGASADLGLTEPGPALIAPHDPAAAAASPVVLTRRRIAWLAATICAAVAVMLASAILMPRLQVVPSLGLARPSVAVLPLSAASDDAKHMAAVITQRLSAGLSRIDPIRVVAPHEATARASLQPRASHSDLADYVIQGELQKDNQGWTLHARMARPADGEIVWASDITITSGDADLETQQSRLAAALGHPIALRLNAILNGATAGTQDMSGSSRAAVEQATASLVQTSPERFRVAQAMLERALARAPDDVDVQAALAALQLRGLQMVWYDPADRDAMRASAQRLLEQALRAKPTYIPVLESYCRLLNATNQFIDSLVACARTLSFDPWNGLAIYHIGLGQIFLGRFEDAFAQFRLADQYDTPMVSRWTWLLGAGVSLICMGRDEEAARWLERSLAVTPGTGRTHFILMAAYQRLGRPDDAKAMLQQGLALRPGATAENVQPPIENSSPLFIEAAARVRELMVAAGLPRR